MTPPRVPLPLPDPPLVDGDVHLRPWTVDDASVLARAWADPEVKRWTGVPPTPDEDYARRWIGGCGHRRADGLALDLAIEVDGTVVGEVGLAGLDCSRRVAEAGWWVDEPHRGRGIASMAVSLLASWAVEELCVDVIVARCAAGNPASGAVARKAGFELARADDGTEVYAFGAVDAAMLQP